MTPLKAIRAKCLECCCWRSETVKACPCPDCPLYPYRLGKGPHITAQRKERSNAQRP